MATIKPKFEMGFGATDAAGARVVTEEMVDTAGFAIRHFCFDDEGSFVGEAKFDDAVRDMLRAVLEAADRCGMSAQLWRSIAMCSECNGTRPCETHRVMMHGEATARLCTLLTELRALESRASER